MSKNQLVKMKMQSIIIKATKPLAENKTVTKVGFWLHTKGYAFLLFFTETKRPIYGKKQKLSNLKNSLTFFKTSNFKSHKNPKSLTKNKNGIYDNSMEI